jgi:hypothetical protein
VPHRTITAVSALLLTLVACAEKGALPRHTPAADSFRTLSFSILEDYDKGDDLEDIAIDFALFRELGVTTWRGSFGWDDYEPAAGKYDFVWVHSFMNAAERSGIDLRPYVAYTPEWAAGGENSDGQAWNQPPADQGAWGAFVRALSSELGHHRNVRSLEIYNEQNVRQWWEGTAVDYARTLASAADAARGLPLVMGGLVFPDLDFVESVCDEGGAARAFGVLPVHAYPETWTPPGVTVENYLGEGFSGDFIANVDRLCGRKRIWINETGFATIPGKTEIDQASWWVRAVATFALEPRIEHIGIYEIKDLPPDRPVIGDAPNYHLGLTRADRKKKLAFSTIRVLVRLFGAQPFKAGPSLVSRTGTTGEFHHHHFIREDGSSLVVIWNRTTDDRVEVALDGQRVTEFELDGTEHEHASARPLTLELKQGIPRVLLGR